MKRPGMLLAFVGGLAALGWVLSRRDDDDADGLDWVDLDEPAPERISLGDIGSELGAGLMRELDRSGEAGVVVVKRDGSIDAIIGRPGELPVGGLEGMLALARRGSSRDACSCNAAEPQPLDHVERLHELARRLREGGR